MCNALGSVFREFCKKCNCACVCIKDDSQNNYYIVEPAQLWELLQQKKIRQISDLRRLNGTLAQEQIEKLNTVFSEIHPHLGKEFPAAAADVEPHLRRVVSGTDEQRASQ